MMLPIPLIFIAGNDGVPIEDNERNFENCGEIDGVDER